MSNQLSEKREILINEIAKKEGLENYNLEVNTGSSKGDNYLGIIKTVNIRDRNKKKDLELILKESLINEELRKNQPIRLAYERESYLYTKIFKEFDKFQLKQCGRIIFNGKAKCYGTCLDECNECIVLENLRSKGYTLWERSKPMNPEHIEIVIKEYARFHGVAMAFKNINPNLYEDITKSIKENIFEMYMKRDAVEASMKGVIERGFKSVASSSRASVAFGKFASSIKKLFTEDVLDTKHEVIIHGDCWCNNMLFKYENENPTKPSKVCLIDFQLSKTGIPVQDLSYFLYICCSKDTLYQHKKYLKIYHETLSQVLKELGCDPNLVFTYEDLELQWQKISKYGLYMTAIVLKVVLSEVDESPDIQELANQGLNISDALAINSVHDEEYNQRLIDILIFMDENNYL